MKEETLSVVQGWTWELRDFREAEFSQPRAHTSAQPINIVQQGITSLLPHLAVDVVCLRPEYLPDRLVETLVRPREEEGVARVVLGLLGLDGVPSLQVILVDFPWMIK